MTHSRHQRHGIASEVVRAAAAHLAASGHSAVRMAVVEDNKAGLAFALHLGFRHHGNAETSEGDVHRHVALLELTLT